MNREQIQDSQVFKETCVCPWHIVRLFDNSLRPLLHNPRKLFAPYVGPGMTVLDIGCGRGFASLGLARLVGDEGLVISADIQPQMLRMVEQRAMTSGLSHCIRIHRCEPDRIGVREELDFVLAFFMVHEVPNKRSFLAEVLRLLKPSGRFFIAEPKFHTTALDFERMVQEAEELGFTIAERPRVRFSRAVVLARDGMVSDRTAEQEPSARTL